VTGTYTDIVEIVAPSSAVAGSTVVVEVKIKNLYSQSLHIFTAGYVFTEMFLYQDAWVAPGSVQSFVSTFVMPTRSVTIEAYSYYEGADGGIYYDDSASKSVTLAAPPEVYAGTISRKRLEHDGTYDSIPAYNIPQGQRGLIHVWGRNDMSTTQALGIDWVVRDPDGIEVEHYWDWSYGHGPGDDHEFIGGRFNLAKSGTYTISVALSMNPADPEIVDTYYGNLCTVAAAVPEPEFRGFGVTEYITV